MTKKQPFGFRDQLGYFFGDYANGLFFSLTASYLTLFYVDVLGISAASVGMLLLVARIWDAINDPVIGHWIDQRPSDPVHGKFRPWILYMAVPVVVLGVLSFTAVPALIVAPLHVKLIYAYITYIGFGMSYTAINIPYGSLASTMTDVETERTSLSIFRSYGGIAAGLTLSTLIPLIVFDHNQQPTGEGFIKVGIILGTISMICYFLCNKLTTERILISRQESNEHHDKYTFTETLKGIVANRPLMIQMIVGMLSIGIFLVQSTLIPYLFKDFFQNAKALSFNGLLLISTTIVISIFMKPLVAKYGKKMVGVFGIGLYTLAWTVYLLSPFRNIVSYFIFSGIAQLGITCMTLITWAFIPDCIDYQEYVTGVREEGTIYAIYSFSRKLGQAAAGFLGSYALIFSGYIANQASQSPETLEKIFFLVRFIPAALGAILTVILYFGYNLNKNELAVITQSLREKRSFKK
ncbi:MAG: MFS transporter [Brevinema sp.]